MLGPIESDRYWCFSDKFINDTNNMNWKYCDNPHYITGLQFYQLDFNSFIDNWNKNLAFFWKKKKILGIGNLCRIFYPTEFTDKIFAHLEKNYDGIHWVHFYGLSLRLIKHYIPKLLKTGMKISVDSTKWTKACTNELKMKYGLNCKQSNRDEFFLEYFKSLSKSGIECEF